MLNSIPFVRSFLSFHTSNFIEAVAQYTAALVRCKEKLGDMDILIGDIHVKIANIHQGDDRLEEAMEHLIRAKEVYYHNLTQCERAGEDTMAIRDDSLEQKWIEIVTNIANIYVDLRQTERAHDTYKEALEISRGYLPKNDPQIAATLNNYGQFLSMCRGDHDKSLVIFKEALKVQYENSLGKIDLRTASTLSNMGKVYMRKSKMSNGPDGRSDAKRAEACFVRALQLYRLSLVRSGNEKVTETLYNLSEAREWQKERKGILRNVQFDSPVLPPVRSNSSCDETEYSQHTHETLEDDLEKYSKDASCLFNGPGGGKNETFLGNCFNLLGNNTFESDYTNDSSSTPRN